MGHINQDLPTYLPIKSSPYHISQVTYVLLPHLCHVKYKPHINYVSLFTDHASFEQLQVAAIHVLHGFL